MESQPDNGNTPEAPAGTEALTAELDTEGLGGARIRVRTAAGRPMIGLRVGDVVAAPLDVDVMLSYVGDQGGTDLLYAKTQYAQVAQPASLSVILAVTELARAYAEHLYRTDRRIRLEVEAALGTAAQHGSAGRDTAAGHRADSAEEAAGEGPIGDVFEMISTIVTPKMADVVAGIAEGLAASMFYGRTGDAKPVSPSTGRQGTRPDATDTLAKLLAKLLSTE